MDEFRVQVVDVAEEAERLKNAAKEAVKAKDKDKDDEGGEEEMEATPSIDSHIQVKTQRQFSWIWWAT